MGPPNSAPGTPAAHHEQDFEQWYQADFDYVWRCLRRLGVSVADATDLAHDVFVVAWQKRDGLDPERARRPWLFGVAFRIASSHRRRAWFRRTRPLLELDVADGGMSPEQQALMRAELRVLEQALQAVPLKQRGVLVLHDFEETDAAVVAQSLAIPLKTVYSRLAAARQTFRQAYRRLQLSGAALDVSSNHAAGE